MLGSIALASQGPAGFRRAFRSGPRRATSAILGLLGLLALPEVRADEPDRAPDDETCLACHADEKAMGGLRVVDPAVLKGSPHGADSGVRCVDCHPRAAQVPDVSEHGPLGPASCEACHDAASSLRGKAHDPSVARAGARVPSCATCHGAGHDLRAVRAARSPIAPNNQPGTCGACHSSSIFKDFSEDVHGRALKAGRKSSPTCSSCHGSHAMVRPDLDLDPASRAAMTRTCAGCHPNAGTVFAASVHGQALLGPRRSAAPGCPSCHGGHPIRGSGDPRSGTHPTQVAHTCAGCHADERLIRRFHLPAGVVRSYELSYHGKASELGDARVAHCGSCHGVHDIFHAEDPRSSVHPDRLQASCGKCHPGASRNFIAARIHAPPAGEPQSLAWFVRRLYIGLIVVLIGAMALHNLLDFIGKMVRRARRRAATPGIVRMSRKERVAHALLLVLFLFLAWTGFALMAPHAFFAAPLHLISDSEAVRSWAHRVAGVLLGLLALQQTHYLLLDPVGRDKLRALWPRVKDLRQLGQHLLFFVGQRPTRPDFGRYGYVEKIEFWALVWGLVLMGVSGVVLWFEETALGLMPLGLWEVFQVIHRYEAILAVLAVAVWHFYQVFANPDHAPMSLVWLDGRATVHELERLHRAELEALRGPGESSASLSASLNLGETGGSGREEVRGGAGGPAQQGGPGPEAEGRPARAAQVTGAVPATEAPATEAPAQAPVTEAPAQAPATVPEAASPEARESDGDPRPKDR